MGELERLSKYTIVVCPKCGDITGKHIDFPESEWQPCSCGTEYIKIGKPYTQYFFMTPDERKEWDAHMREKYTLHSDVFDEELYQKTLEGDFERRLGIETEKRELEIQSREVSTKPHCPICNSTNLSKITTAKKVGKIAMFGIFGMGDNGKTWKCNGCGSKF